MGWGVEISLPCVCAPRRGCAKACASRASTAKSGDCVPKLYLCSCCFQSLVYPMVRREVCASHTHVQPFRTGSPNILWPAASHVFLMLFLQEFSILLPPSPLLEYFFSNSLSLCLASFWRWGDPVSVLPPPAFPSASRMFSPWHLGSASV